MQNLPNPVRHVVYTAPDGTRAEAISSTAPSRPAWEIASWLLPAAAYRLAAVREDIVVGIAHHDRTDGSSFLDTAEYARLKSREYRRDAVIRRLVDAMAHAIPGGAR